MQEFYEERKGIGQDEHGNIIDLVVQVPAYAILNLGKETMAKIRVEKHECHKG